MEWAELVGAIIVALLIGAVFYFGFKNTGPWALFGLFFWY